MNKIQFNAIMFIATVIVFSQKPNSWSFGWMVFVSIVFAISYFSQKEQ